MIIASGFREQENPNFRYLFAFEKHASQSRRKSAQLVDNTHDGAASGGYPPALRSTVASAASTGRNGSKGKNAENKGLSVWSQICSPSTSGTISGGGAVRPGGKRPLGGFAVADEYVAYPQYSFTVTVTF